VRNSVLGRNPFPQPFTVPFVVATDDRPQRGARTLDLSDALAGGAGFGELSLHAIDLRDDG